MKENLKLDELEIRPISKDPTYLKFCKSLYLVHFSDLSWRPIS